MAAVVITNIARDPICTYEGASTINLSQVQLVQVRDSSKTIGHSQ